MIPVKYVFVEYRSLVLPILFTAPIVHAEFAPLHTIRSAGYAKRVSSLGVQAFDRSESLGLGPDENDSLRLSSILAGQCGTLNYAIVQRDGEPFPVVTTLPIMELAKYPVIRDGVGDDPENFGCASVVERGLGVVLHPHALPLERGAECVPPPSVEQVLNFWLHAVLEVRREPVA